MCGVCGVVGVMVVGVMVVGVMVAGVMVGGGDGGYMVVVGWMSVVVCTTHTHTPHTHTVKHRLHSLMVRNQEMAQWNSSRHMSPSHN